MRYGREEIEQLHVLVCNNLLHIWHDGDLIRDQERIRAILWVAEDGAHRRWPQATCT